MNKPQQNQQTTGIRFVTSIRRRKPDGDSKSILLCIICSVLLTPITFHLTRFRASSPLSDLLACLLTLTLSVIFVYVIHNVLKQRCQPPVPQEKPPRQKFTIFYSSVPTTPKDKPSPGRSRIDPKYFKPKFIISELMSIWGTTYTVITWGSVYVIGGTIVATERLANKIKTKCAREPRQGLHDTSGASGWSESFSSFSGAPTSTQRPSEAPKGPLSRATSWTKKSFASAKKKFNRFVGTGLPRLTGSDSIQSS